MRILVLLIFIIGSYFYRAQDTLVLGSAIDHSRTIKIPFARFEVKVVTKNSERYRCVIDNYEDSTLFIRTISKDSKVSEETFQEKQKYHKIIKNGKWKTKQIDSLRRVRDSIVERIYYPNLMKIKTSDLKKVRIHKRNIAQKKLLLRNLKLFLFLSLFVHIILFATVFLFNPIVPPILWSIQLIAFLFARHSRLNFVKKWKVIGKSKN